MPRVGVQASGALSSRLTFTGGRRWIFRLMSGSSVPTIALIPLRHVDGPAVSNAGFRPGGRCRVFHIGGAPSECWTAGNLEIGRTTGGSAWRQAAGPLDPRADAAPG